MKKPTPNFLFSWVLFLTLGGFFIWGMMKLKSGPDTYGVPNVLKEGLHKNEGAAKKLPLPQIVEYPRSRAVPKPKVNGKYGLKSKLDSAGYRMQVIHPERKDTQNFLPAQIRALPKTEVVFDFKCIEGWNQITWWGGLRFSDFMKKFYPDLLNKNGSLKYAWVGLMTPDQKYYVGIDAESMMQDKTLLCYEMSGKTLPLDQGYPLRLIIPVKYGIKHLKRIGYLYFSNDRPKDYWAEKGYDYDAGH
jgi:DMSO/TMAO reductase YedYZ molybdopterin-dependent catalytic subunit